MRIFVVMTLHGIDDILSDIKFLQDAHTDFDMRPFDLMINRLTDIMQEWPFLATATFAPSSAAIAPERYDTSKNGGGCSACSYSDSAGGRGYRAVSGEARQHQHHRRPPRRLHGSSIDFLLRLSHRLFDAGGWIRPSSINFSSAIRAISRRTGSNEK